MVNKKTEKNKSQSDPIPPNSDSVPRGSINTYSGVENSTSDGYDSDSLSNEGLIIKTVTNI